MAKPGAGTAEGQAARERGPEYTGPPHTHCGVPRPAALPSGGLRERQRPHVNELTHKLHTQHSLRSTKMKDLVSKPHKNFGFY